MVILNALDIDRNPSPEHDPGEDNLPPAKTIAPHGRLKVLNPRRHQGALLAQQLVTVALREHSASAVARHLGVSRDLVYGWGYGKTALTVGDLLASANFASERGWSDERVCEYLERFVARIRSGEAQASAEAFKAEWNAAREGK